MNKHTVAVTAALGAPLGFLAGILYSAYCERDQRRQETIDTQEASLGKLRGQFEELAIHQRNQWSSIQKLNTDLKCVSKGLEKQPR